MSPPDESRDVIVQFVKVAVFPCHDERDTWPVFHMNRIIRTCRSRDDAIAVAANAAMTEGVKAWILDPGADAPTPVWPLPRGGDNTNRRVGD